MQVKNYTLLEVREISEIHATGYLYSHDLTGARLFYLNAPEDDNQVFSIAFATPPENDCGIPHILEHCTLNGSEKYPVKEPFVDLLKGSLNTFLNAMTFSDKTMYPVASRNEKDFMNLMSVYLDAVFFPNLRKDPFIFRQEGWHYELENPESEIVYKGVVYNEMKGAFSSGDTVLDKVVTKAMYPESIYGYVSGGDPDAIPELTYEQFKAFHDKNYHPCNSYIFFYGNGDMEKHMTFVDEEYLQKFGPAEEGMVAVIEDQPRFNEPVEVRGAYAVGETDDVEDKTFLSYSVMLDHPRSAKEFYVMTTLAELLCNGEASPLKLALLKAGIGQDISSNVDETMKQPKLEIVAKNANESQKEEFVKIIREVLDEISVRGFDQKLVEATLSQDLFSMREANYGSAPKGLLYGIEGMNFWLYGDNPMDILAFEAPYAAIKEDAECFSTYVREHVLNNPHTVVAVLVPEQGLNARIDAQIKEKLKAYKASLTKDEIEELVSVTKELIHRQQTPDKPEDLDKLPLLQREDLEEIKPFKTAKAVNIAGRAASVYEDITNQIVYLTVSFNMDCLPEEYIPYAGLLSDLLSDMDTEKYNYMDLDNEIGCHMGGMTVNTTILQKKEEGFIPYFNMGVKFLKEETKASMDLVKEVLLRTDLSDVERMREIINEDLTEMESQMSMYGNRTAASRAFSYFDPYFAYNEHIYGIDYYRFLKNLEKSLDDHADEVFAKLENTLEILIRRENLRLRLTIDEENESMMLEELEAFALSLPEGKSVNAADIPFRYEPVPENEGLITSGKVQFVAKAGRTSVPYNGAMLVLQHITRLDYLWNHIRVMGGAYGSSCSVDKHGRVSMSSFRDPNLKESVEIYKNAGSYLAGYEIDEKELLKYIIGTISGLDPVMTVSMKGKLAHDAMETGMEPDYLTNLSRQVLQTTMDEVHEAAKAMTEAMNEPYLCVIGSETKIKENSDLFDITKNLIE